MVAQALERFGRLDVAFANAGFGAARGFLNDDPEHWREMVLTNVLGAAYTVRATLPALKESTGHILLTGSVAGRRAIPGSLYSSTKWAITGMGESLRQDVDGTGVRVTVVEPGMVDTPFFDNPGEGRLRGRRHRPRGACSPSPSPRTSTSTRSSSGPRRSRGSLEGWDASSDQSAAAARPTRRRRCGARARPSRASAPQRGEEPRAPRATTSAARTSSSDVEDAMREHDERERDATR